MDLAYELKITPHHWMMSWYVVFSVSWHPVETETVLSRTRFQSRGTRYSLCKFMIARMYFSRYLRQLISAHADCWDICRVLWAYASSSTCAWLHTVTCHTILGECDDRSNNNNSFRERPMRAEWNIDSRKEFDLLVNQCDPPWSESMKVDIQEKLQHCGT